MIMVKKELIISNETSGFLFFSEWAVGKNKGDTATLLDAKGNEVSTFDVPNRK